MFRCISGFANFDITEFDCTFDIKTKLSQRNDRILVFNHTYLPCVNSTYAVVFNIACIWMITNIACKFGVVSHSPLPEFVNYDVKFCMPIYQSWCRIFKKLVYNYINVWCLWKIPPKCTCSLLTWVVKNKSSIRMVYSHCITEKHSYMYNIYVTNNLNGPLHAFRDKITFSTSREFLHWLNIKRWIQ